MLCKSYPTQYSHSEITDTTCVSDNLEMINNVMVWQKNINCQ
jgi:hypothetical protein